MDLGHGLAFRGGIVCSTGAAAADGWCRCCVLAWFEYMGGRGEERTVIEKHDATGPSQPFDQIDTLRIIFLNSLLVPIIEIRILRKLFGELEASRGDSSSRRR